VSYQREDERYWTDYLRVALPIVGLLLLVGLLWFWLASIIGDDDENPPTEVPSTALTITAPTSTQTTQAVIDVTATSVPAGQPTNTPGGEQPAPTNTPEGAEGQPTEEGGEEEEARFAEGDAVVTNDPDINLRAEPSTDAEVVTQFGEGTELTITGPSEQGGDYTWWPVEDADGNVGYVADDFLDPAE
jgi:hypothetical protein